MSTMRSMTTERVHKVWQLEEEDKENVDPLTGVNTKQIQKKPVGRRPFQDLTPQRGTSGETTSYAVQSDDSFTDASSVAESLEKATHVNVGASSSVGSSTIPFQDVGSYSKKSTIAPKTKKAVSAVSKMR
eukprot:GFYU01017031.1.p1 GENE.GFYU01017031.1~~GFYU01017031.1.p1  ORF type:complete len:130 (-),score=31.92 GFYU01017031.1:318-707(-)